MLAHALRELRRRALRTTLTATGIAIGAAALVLLGALAEKTTRLIAGGRDFGAGQITVAGAGASAQTGMTRGTLLSAEQLDAVRAVPGVATVVPIALFPVDATPASLPFTLPPLVFGVDVAALFRNQSTPPPRAAEGVLVPDVAREEVVVGSQVARRYGLHVGDVLAVRGHDFHVAGILEPTLTGPDSFVFMPFPLAQRLLVDAEPMLRRMAQVPGARVLPVATAAAVFWPPGEDPEALAARIRAAVPGVTVMSPRETAAQVDKALVFLNALVVGAGLAALVVASLAVANTMVTAVVERRREIGLRRVVGATRRQVMRQLLAEAVTLGLLGGALGLAGGAAATHALNGLTERMGAPVFLLTPRLVAAALLLPPLLSALAGMLPAWRAARRPPTEALRWA